MVMNFFVVDPATWTKVHVKDWLVKIANEFDVKDMELKKFSTTDGYKLCQMTMRDLGRIIEKSTAEIILTQLSILKRSKNANPKVFGAFA